MVVLFVDGTKMKIHPNAVKVLKELIESKDGAKSWQSFTDSATGKFMYTLNLQHVSCITEEENFYHD